MTALAAITLAACAAPVETETAEVDVADEQTVEQQLIETTDPFLWLEEVEGEEALSWVTAQNERSLAELTADPEFEARQAAVVDIVTSDERIAYGSIRSGHVYNFWQDKTNVRGLWRRATVASYKTESPEWETVLDFDRLAAEEDANWVYKGSNCFAPYETEDYRCMISLSDGGKDAVIMREFDLTTKSFVEGGFITHEAKQGVSWVDKDTLLIGTDWGEGSLTESGYPNVIKRWTRGTPLESAEQVFRGDVTDVASRPWVLELEDGRRLQGVIESDTFFTNTYWWAPDGESELVKWPVPPKSSFAGVYQGKVMLTLQQDWAPEGQDGAFMIGDLVAFDVEPFLETRELPPVELVFRPTAAQAVNGVSIAKGAALISINDNVVAKILRLTLGDNGWTASPIALPGAGQASITFADKDEETVFVNYEGFLTPDSLLNYDVTAGEMSVLKSLPGKFDTTGLKVEQHFATSADGTRVPYFLVMKEGIELDGTTPTLLYGYGGFEISMRPGYNASIGRLWLEKGGAYVLANIRGGGEFGPAWHQAGLKLNRQRIYDDFIAIGEDLIARGVTSPAHLGIMGGSNGGLLMGVMLNQRPDLWNAVIVQVPLLDMLRYHKLLAGASWVDEYGSPDVPEERAFLETISPYQNFDASKPYPTPFFVTSTKDDRVHPGHARKLAAKFEAAGLPFYYYENIDGGHSAAANQMERAKRSALEFTYLTQRLFPEPAAE